MRVTLHVGLSTVGVDVPSGRGGRELILVLRAPMESVGATVQVMPPSPSLSGRLYALPPAGQTTEDLARRLRTWLRLMGHEVEG